MTNPTVTPPLELKQQWREQAPRYRDGGVGREHWLIERTAQWVYEQCGEVNEAELQQARDQELEATLAEVSFLAHQALAARVRAARRPKPPTLAEQGLTALRSTPCTEQCHYDALLAALNRLKQLEDSND